MQKSFWKPFVAAALLTSLMLFVVTNPAIAGGQPPKADKEMATFAELMTRKYLTFVGYTSVNTTDSEFVQKPSSVQLKMTYEALRSGAYVIVAASGELRTSQGGTTDGYTYNAEISSSNAEQYSIQSAYSVTSGQTETTTIATEQITGSANYYINATEETTTGDPITRVYGLDFEFTNSSGSFFVSVSGSETKALDGTILSGFSTMDQNLVEPVGLYEISIEPSKDSSTAKITVTMPDGTLVDPGIYQFVDSWHGSNHLVGWKLWWEPGISAGLGLILSLLGILLYTIETAGLGLSVIGLVLALSAFFVTTSGYTYNYYEIVYYVWWIFSVPIFAETGYWTNQYIEIPFGPVHNLGGYWYMPLFNTNTLFRNAPLWPYVRTGAWPPGY